LIHLSLDVSASLVVELGVVALVVQTLGFVAIKLRFGLVVTTKWLINMELDTAKTVEKRVYRDLRFHAIYEVFTVCFLL